MGFCLDVPITRCVCVGGWVGCMGWVREVVDMDAYTYSCIYAHTRVHMHIHTYVQDIVIHNAHTHTYTQDMAIRKRTREMEFVWRGSSSLGADADVFAVNLDGVLFLLFVFLLPGCFCCCHICSTTPTHTTHTHKFFPSPSSCPLISQPHPPTHPPTSSTPFTRVLAHQGLPTPTHTHPSTPTHTHINRVLAHQGLLVVLGGHRPCDDGRPRP